MTLLATQAGLHTRLLLRTLDDLTDEDGLRRLDHGTNNARFIAAHLVESRHWTLQLLGSECPPVFDGTLAYGTSIDTVGPLPTLAAIRAEWEAISPALEERLAGLDAAALGLPSTRRFPVDDATLGGTLAFLLHHEAYHIGQLGLLRRAVGLPAMRYR